MVYDTEIKKGAIILLRSYCKRIFICIFSLALFGFGNLLGVKAGNAGTNAWNTLSLGLNGAFGISFGTATMLVSLVIITLDLLGKGKLGIGSVLNFLLIPFFSDLFLTLFAAFPEAGNPVTGALLSLSGQITVSFATVFYMLPGLGCGPRDTLMVLIGRKLPKIPIGAVKFAIEAAALLAGTLLGAPFGVGTLLIMVLQAGIFQFVCRLLHYEPRNVQHEDMKQTFTRLLRSKEAL